MSENEKAPAGGRRGRGDGVDKPTEQLISTPSTERCKQANFPIPVVLAFEEDGLAYIICPICGSGHTHAAGDGHRLAHCIEPPANAGYILKMAGPASAAFVERWAAAYVKVEREFLRRQRAAAQRGRPRRTWFG